MSGLVEPKLRKNYYTLSNSCQMFCGALSDSHGNHVLVHSVLVI